jgi:hypothetical protein
MKPNSPSIFITIPTKAQSKFMKRHKGKKQVEEGNSFVRVIKNKHLLKQNKFRKCCNWSKWDPNNDNGQNESVWVACLLFIG